MRFSNTVQRYKIRTTLCYLLLLIATYCYLLRLIYFATDKHGLTRTFFSAEAWASVCLIMCSGTSLMPQSHMSQSHDSYNNVKNILRVCGISEFLCNFAEKNAIQIKWPNQYIRYYMTMYSMVQELSRRIIAARSLRKRHRCIGIS